MAVTVGAPGVSSQGLVACHCMAGGLALKVELDTGTADPGATVRGRVVVRRSLQVQRLTVELQLIERTSGTRALRRCPKQVIAESAELDEGHSVAFSLSLPNDAENTWSTGTAQQTWEVRARAEVRGLDHQAGADLTAPQRPLARRRSAGRSVGRRSPFHPDSSRSGSAELVTSAERITACGQRTNELAGWGLSALGVFIATTTATVPAKASK